MSDPTSQGPSGGDFRASREQKRQDETVMLNADSLSDLVNQAKGPEVAAPADPAPVPAPETPAPTPAAGPAGSSGGPNIAVIVAAVIVVVLVVAVIAVVATR